jgi:nucleoside-diphosphate-sugar epimerase
VCRNSRLAERVGWSAQYPLAEGFRDAARWYRAQGWLK